MSTPLQPMQWSGALGRMVPANGMMPVADGASPGAVLVQAIEPLEPLPEVVRKFIAQVHPTKPLNVLALAKARLKEVKSELKKLKVLEKEKGELERLIAAAAKPQKSNLREIKRSVG